MQRVTVLYPNGDRRKFDFDYYLTKHAVGGWVWWRIEVRRGVSSPTGSPHSYASPPFTSSLQASGMQFLRQHGPQIMADIPNYTNSSPLLRDR
jgi:hypothetical protein